MLAVWEAANETALVRARAIPWPAAPLGAAAMADDPCPTAFSVAAPDLANYYYRARYYDPKAGRFISEDPMRFVSGANFYEYAGSNPTNRRDPSGQEWRWPDFISGNLSIAIPNPVTETLVGWNGTVSADRYGNWYYSGAGVTVGKSATGVAGSVTLNWMNQCSRPSATTLNNMLSGNGFNVAAGYWGGAAESYTPGTGWATGVGFVSPQIGGSYNYSWQGAGTTFWGP